MPAERIEIDVGEDLTLRVPVSQLRTVLDACVAEGTAVYLHTAATDMRLGVDRLSEKIKAELNCSPLNGGAVKRLKKLIENLF